MASSDSKVIPVGIKVAIPSSVTITNIIGGNVTNKGFLNINSGTFINIGSVSNTGTINNKGTVINSGSMANLSCISPKEKYDTLCYE